MLYLLIIAKMVQMQKHFLWKHTPANQVLEGMEHMFRFCSKSGHPYESPLVCLLRSVLTEPSMYVGHDTKYGLMGRKLLKKYPTPGGSCVSKMPFLQESS